MTRGFTFILVLISFAGICSEPTTSKPKKGSVNLSPGIILKENVLQEASGIVCIKGSYWVIADGGNSNSIYRIDATTGKIVQEVKITNASNTDWEELTCSDTHLYIGDFGNNNGNRKNLGIYKVSLDDLKPEATEITAAYIGFSYADQTTFKMQTNNNNFDCEAMIYKNGKLNLFTKNWRDLRTRVYSIPVDNDYCIAQCVDSFETGFMVTGASLYNDRLFLCGYSPSGDVKLMTTEINGTFFTNCNTYYCGIILSCGQVEGICMNSNGGFLISEKFTFSRELPAVLRPFSLNN